MPYSLPRARIAFPARFVILEHFMNILNMHPAISALATRVTLEQNLRKTHMVECRDCKFPGITLSAIFPFAINGMTERKIGQNRQTQRRKGAKERPSARPLAAPPNRNHPRFYPASRAIGVHLRSSAVQPLLFLPALRLRAFAFQSLIPCANPSPALAPAATFCIFRRLHIAPCRRTAWRRLWAANAAPGLARRPRPATRKESV